MSPYMNLNNNFFLLSILRQKYRKYGFKFLVVFTEFLKEAYLALPIYGADSVTTTEAVYKQNSFFFSFCQSNMNVLFAVNISFCAQEYVSWSSCYMMKQHLEQWNCLFFVVLTYYINIIKQLFI